MRARGDVYSIAIVGGGQAAKAILMILAERAMSQGAARSPMRVAIFERGREIGPGFAWSSTQNLTEHVASQPGAASRVQYGREQVRVVERLVTALIAVNVHVDLFSEVEIVDLQRSDGKWILLAENSTWRAEAVVLATGHWRNTPPELAEIPHQYPWPATLLQETVVDLPPGGDIAVLGSYHTAIDTALTIALALGRFEEHSNHIRYVANRAFKTTLLSRTGRLPLVWPGVVPKFEPRYLRETFAGKAAPGERGTLRLEELLCAVRRELSERSGRNAARTITELTRLLDKLYLHDSFATLERCLEPRKWTPRNLGRMAAMATLLPLVSELFPYLDAGSYLQFQRRYRTAFFNVAMPMPRITAKRIRALMGAGVLAVEAIGRYSWRVVNGKPTLFRQIASSESAGRSFDLLANGLASCGAIARHPGRLMRSLLAKGIIAPASREYAAADWTPGRKRLLVAGVQIDHRSCEVMPAATAAGAARSGCRLYAMGPNNEGLFLDAQSIGQLARDAARIVSHMETQRAG